jgi:2,4-dienoyl-CoA reductase-like NADH-dependent reductase (Old Yellow Enzyme family)/thioredoxin reductase
MYGMLKKLFSEFSLKGKTVKNRLVVPAMVTNFCDESGNGNLTEKYIAYHEAKAKGGFGLIITEANLVTEYDRAFSKPAGLWNDIQIKSHTELTKRVHAHGTLILAQLIHNGRQTNERAAGGKIYAPSSIKDPLSPDMPVELTIEMIEELVSAFGDAALRAKKSGYDGVEIHGAHGYLISQFMSHFSNKRTDKYGGNLMSRLRFPLEIIADIRKKCGDDFIIGFRLSGDEFIEGGLTIEDTKAIAMILEGAGVDIFHVSAGIYASSEMIIPTFNISHGWNVSAAEEVKKVCSVPVIAVGRINDPIIAESVIKSGKADFVAMGRASLADPELPNKAKEGRFEDIRPCIACTIGCLGLLYKDVPIKCVLNPSLGREAEQKIEKTKDSKNVIVVGAGPAGLEAAITAAAIGHNVRVCEKEDRAGGQFKVAAIPPTKGEISGFVSWQEEQLKKLGVSVEYNTYVTLDFIKANPSDIVIIATGGSPVIPNIQGSDLPHVYTAVDVLSGKAEVGSTVVIIGGGKTGAETAHHLAIQNKKVTLVEIARGIAKDAAFHPRQQLLNYLNKRGVNILTNTTVGEIDEKNVKILGKTEMEIPADTVVMAVGTKSENKLVAELENIGVKTAVIGDAESIGTVMEALEQGRAIGKLS